LRVLHVVGARPNFMKAAPVLRALSRRGVDQVLVHTGQHYDAAMSDVFFEQLGLPTPDVNLNVGSGSHAVQTAEVMLRIEPILLERKPDWVLVYGDVNSTIASALVCAKLLIRVAHVEAGLRSNDRTMPEEINRIVTDRIADLLFTPSPDGDENLKNEGVAADRIRLVGNVMIDTLIALQPLARERWQAHWASSLGAERFALLTLHRPSNVDDLAKLERIIATVADIAREIPIIFPIHPRTRQALRSSDASPSSHVQLIEPLGYLDFLALQERASFVITDSGGVQEETTYLGVPCLTLRENTERPVTVTMGTNTLIGSDLEALRREVQRIVDGSGKRGECPHLWDGRAAERIAQELLS
jgi:UDP-N-acetylglucosamine 2-epimerase (non-hydrolysing)